MSDVYLKPVHNFKCVFFLLKQGKTIFDMNDTSCGKMFFCVYYFEDPFWSMGLYSNFLNVMNSPIINKIITFEFCLKEQNVKWLVFRT